MCEKNKLIIIRMSWLIITIILIITLIGVIKYNSKETVLKDCVCYCSEYDGNGTECSIEFEFDGAVDYVSATISFYDNNNQLITNLPIFTSECVNGILCEELYVVGDEIATYEIDDVDFSKPFNGGVFVLQMMISASIFIAFIVFITTLTLKYKVYYFENNIIEVYAGASSHYLKVNGEKCDELNSSIVFTPINLSTTLDNGAKVEARISLTNNISVKINNKLMVPTKTKLNKK